MAAGVAVAAVLVGFLALGEYLPGVDELPYLMAAQSLLRHGSLTVPVNLDHGALHGLGSAELPRLLAREPRSKLHSARPSRHMAPVLSGSRIRRVSIAPPSFVARAGVTPGLGTRFRWLLGSSARAAWLDRAVIESTPACGRACTAWSVQAPLVRSSLRFFTFQLNRHDAIRSDVAASAVLRHSASPIPIRNAVRGWQVPQRC